MSGSDNDFEDVDLRSTNTFLKDIAQMKDQVNRLSDLVEQNEDFWYLKKMRSFAQLSFQLDAIEKSARNEEDGSDSDEEEEPNFIAFDEDTYSLMMMSPVLSRCWILGFATLSFQYSVLILILIDLIIKQSEDSSVLDIPYSVPPEVTIGQFLGIFICVGVQSDVLSSVRMLIAMSHSEDSTWDEIIGIEKQDRTLKNWIIRILFPNLGKFMSGILVLGVNFITIVQSNNIVDLTKDVAALLIISEIPEIFFALANYGFLGNTFYDASLMVLEAEIEDSFDFGRRICGVYFPVRWVVFCTIVLMMFTAVGVLLEGQLSGRYFYERYPYCDINVTEIPQISNDKCEGGIFNTIACGFDGGDCVNFNIQYPNCKKALDPFRIGDGECDQIYNTPECDFDGNDCCPFKTDNYTDPRYGDGVCDGGKFFAGLCQLDFFDCSLFAFEAPKCSYEDLSDLVPFGEEPRLGDGICDSKVYNTPECLFENGDCEKCNAAVFDYRLTGDGTCHGGQHNSKVCNYDAGDCELFNKRWPRCREKTRENIPDKMEIVPIIGDGICNSGLYNNEDCGYENGDCLFCNRLVPNITKIGDGFCDGQQYMSDVCGFDGGDCIGCNALRFEIGDGWCSLEYNTPECSYDGGDCAILLELEDCDVPFPSLLGNGECNGGEYNTEACNYDGGDCLEFKLEGCDEPERRHFLLGDGYCHGFMNNAECAFDGGDCEDFNTQYPNCTFDGLEPSLIGDGSCDGGQYSTLECGWDGNDCVVEL